MKHLMIRADDLGYSEGINYGIEKTIRDGMVRSVGFMVNMPASEHGFHLVRDIEGLCLGQHTNICVGRPLTDPVLIPSLTQKNGEFKSSRQYRAAFAQGEDFVDLDEVLLEIEAQYERFVQITGRQPQYFEGHAVESANFMKGLEIAADRHGLKFLNTSFDGSPITVNGQSIYVWMESAHPDYDPMYVFKKMAENCHSESYDLLILHPGYLDEYILTHSSLTRPRPKEVDFAISNELKSYLQEQELRLYTFDDL